MLVRVRGNIPRWESRGLHARVGFGVLRGRVVRPVTGRGAGHGKKWGLVRCDVRQELQRSVGNAVGEVIGGVVIAMYFTAIVARAYCVTIVLGISDKTVPPCGPQQALSDWSVWQARKGGRGR